MKPINDTEYKKNIYKDLKFLYKTIQKNTSIDTQLIDVLHIINNIENNLQLLEDNEIILNKDEQQTLMIKSLVYSEPILSKLFNIMKKYNFNFEFIQPFISNFIDNLFGLRKTSDFTNLEDNIKLDLSIIKILNINGLYIEKLTNYKHIINLENQNLIHIRRYLDKVKDAEEKNEINKIFYEKVLLSNKIIKIDNINDDLNKKIKV